MEEVGRMSFSCRHQNICGSCTCPDWPLKKQIEFKQNKLFTGLGLDLLQSANINNQNDIQYISIGLSQIRDRADMIYDPKVGLGYYQKKSPQQNHADSSLSTDQTTPNLFAVEYCEMMSAELQNAFQKLKKILDLKALPIQHKGSLRLRVLPLAQNEMIKQNLKTATGSPIFAGLWLDFANSDIKLLLDEKHSLLQLLENGFFVEIGQKRKSLQIDNSGLLKLKDPQFLPWTKTWVQNKDIYLQSCVGSFSQAGSLANKAIISELEKFFAKTTSINWLEFGAGTGNLTFALASNGRIVQAVELEPLAALAINKNKAQVKLDGHNYIECIKVVSGDFQKIHQLDFARYQGVLVNPPRSGLKEFLTPLMEIDFSQRPIDLVYMSCFLDSFSIDAKKISALGYQLQDISIVDQFPQTEHFEILSRWRLIGNT